MKILSRNVSEKTEKIVSSIEASVHFPIHYQEISARPNQSYASFGTVNPHPVEGAYNVWLSTQLPQDVFETDLLHELRHIVQVESGYSEVYNKETNEFHSKDRAFIQEVGAHISSVVLDIDVDIWLNNNGYTQEYFFRTNYDNFLSACNYKYTLLNDPLNFANLCHALLQISVHCDDKAAQILFNAYSAYPDVIKTVSELRNSLRPMKIDNPIASSLAHCLVIDTLQLWKYYYISSSCAKIRTNGEYCSFLALHSQDARS